MRATLPEIRLHANLGKQQLVRAIVETWRVRSENESRCVKPITHSRVFDAMVHSAKTIAKPQGRISGFKRRKLPGAGIEVDALVGGSGPPLLLLHGFPQTRMMWTHVAPALADRFTLVMPDLRGYGRTDKPVSDRRHMTYAKRTMALDQVEMM